jgi:hypothetical protein
MKEGLGLKNRCGSGANSLPFGLAGLREKRYMGCNLQFSYDRVVRVGPTGPALFCYLNLFVTWT